MSCEGCKIKTAQARTQTITDEAKKYAAEHKKVVAVYKDGEGEPRFGEYGYVLTLGLPVLEIIHLADADIRPGLERPAGAG